MTEYEILSFIHKNGNVAGYSDLTVASISSFDPDILSDCLRLKYLINENFVSGEASPGNVLSLTDKGIVRLDELSKERADKRSQRIFEVVLAVISALAGALLSQPLWNWIK